MILIRKIGLRALIAAACIGLMLLTVPFVSAALADPCVQGETPSGCADVKLSDPSMLADFYVGETLAATGVNSARLNIPPSASVKIEARNVHDASPEFGDIYTYSNASTNAYVTAGQSKAYTLTPKKQFLKGFLVLTCNPANQQADEGIICRPTIDGVVMPDILPNIKTTYALLPGKHALHIDLLGDTANRWNTVTSDTNVTITAGRSSNSTVKFTKRGLLTIALNPSGVTADLYVDGTMIAPQAVSAQIWVTSGASHKVEARSVTDPVAANIYKWKDASSNTSVGAGQQRTVTLKLTKEYLVGFLDLTCQLDGYQATDDVLCNVNIDGATVGAQKPSSEVRYNLAKGNHTVNVTLSGSASGRWEISKTNTITIRLGASTKSTMRFKAATVASPSYTGTFSGLDYAALQVIYKRGQQLGNNPHHFSRIGDSESATSDYLSPFGWGKYNLGSYQYLDPVISYFSGSFDYSGQAVRPGMPADALLDPIWASPSVCKHDENSLQCELRINKPVIALILIRTEHPDAGLNGLFHQELKAIVQTCLDRGVIPVLSTAPYWPSPHPDSIAMNDTIRNVAAEYKVPLWDLWVTLEALPNRGVGDDNGHTSIPSDHRVTYFESGNMQWGMVHRNLEALEILHALMTNVIKK